MERGKTDGCTRDQLHRPKYGKNPFKEGSAESLCFGNGDSKTNGELVFFNTISSAIKSIYDVGADTSNYLQFSGEVHYFEPIASSNIFRQISTDNSKSYFNVFGLSNITSDKLRITWETGDVLPNPTGEDTLLGDNIYMRTMRAEDYMIENDFNSVDFVSIDTEGHEYQVLQGFGDFLHNVKVIQFEYGGCTWAAGNKLGDMITYLQRFNFGGFSYLHPQGLVPVNWDKYPIEHYDFCNIVCVNAKYSKELEESPLAPWVKIR
mgnify:FL=1